MDFTALGSGYFRVFLDDEQISQHITEREANESAVNAALAHVRTTGESKTVRITHDYEVEIMATPNDLDISGWTLQPESPLYDGSRPTNSRPTGGVYITGTAEQGEVLTCTNDLYDDNGLGTFSYQWANNNDGNVGTDSTTYTVQASDVGDTLTCTISYTDNSGQAESKTSSATVAVTGAGGSGFEMDSNNSATSLPAYLSFSDNTYVTTHSYAENGGAVAHSAGTSWDGSNCIRYTLPTSAGSSYLKAINNLQFPTEPATLYIRYCQRYHSDYPSPIAYNQEGNGQSAKSLIVHTDNSGGTGTGRVIENWGIRSDAINGNWMLFLAGWGTSNTTGAYDDIFPELTIGARDGVAGGDILDKWICVEYKIDMSVTPNRVEQYITLRDGTQYGASDPYSIGTDGAPAEDFVDYIELVGMYTDAGYSGGTIDISHFRADASYIGPPAGFVI